MAASLRFKPDYLQTRSAMKFSSLRFESADCSKGSGAVTFTMGFLYNEVFFDIGKVFPGIPTTN